MDILDQFGQTRRKLDTVSSSFCLAKWMQVTIHLQNGFNHSCHHPNLHKISLDEIKENPSALHNTAYKKELRAQMLKGERPKECDYCWRVEDTAGAHYSDRIVKSSDYWAMPAFEKIASAPPDRDINPSYVEVSFGHDCNFKCAYCAPNISSSIWKSYEKWGPYVNRNSLEDIKSQGLAPYPAGEANPYIEAFWRWFPDLAKDLKVFRVTGGEPLVNPNTFKVLDYIEANPLPHLELCINSNLGIADRFYDKFIDQVKRITADQKIKKFVLYTSVDTHGVQAEYLRTGLNYEKWLQRLRHYLTNVPWDVHFMMTFNATSPYRFIELLKDLLALNKEFLVHDESLGRLRKRTMMDISHLMHPEYLSILILDDDGRKRIGEIVEFMEAHEVEKVGPWGFHDYEIHKIRRIFAFVSQPTWTAEFLKWHRQFFYKFTRQHLEREGKDVHEIIPEMRGLVALCKEEVERENPPATV